MTNAGFPVTIDGQEYLTTQLGQAAWEYLVNCLRIEFIQQQTKLLKMQAEMDDDRVNHHDVEAIRAQAFAMNRNHIASTNWFFSDTGSCHLIHQLLKPANPTVTLAKCRKWAEDGFITKDVFNIMLETIMAGRGTNTGDGQAGEPANPPTPPTSTTS